MATKTAADTANPQGERRSKTPSQTASARPGWISTPWGRARLLERVVLPQRAGEKRFNTLVELIETERGERLVRLAYSTDGVARRGPVTIRARELERLRAVVARAPELAAVLGLGGDA
jgi:hypothetical protein